MFSYEDLDVYKLAFEINRQVYRQLKKSKAIPTYAKYQFGRACISIMLNIAEGSGKFSKKDRRNYFVIARGSTFECGSIVNLLAKEGDIDLEWKEELSAAFDRISIMLYKMIRNLEA